MARWRGWLVELLDTTFRDKIEYKKIHLDPYKCPPIKIAKKIAQRAPNETKKRAMEPKRAKKCRKGAQKVGGTFPTLFAPHPSLHSSLHFS